MTNSSGAAVQGLAGAAANATPYGAAFSALGQIGAAAVQDAPTIQNPVSGLTASPFSVNVTTGRSNSGVSWYVVLAGVAIFAFLLSHLLHR